MRKFYRLCIWSLLLGIAAQAQAATVTQKLYLNPGQLVTVDSTILPYAAFNETGTFLAANKTLLIAPGDSLILTLVNRDSISHSMGIWGQASLFNLMPGDSSTLQYFFPNRGVFGLQETIGGTFYDFIGASTMIVVDSPSDHQFYWNLREHDAAFHQAIRDGNTPNRANFKPSWFTVNSRSKPDIDLDPTAAIRGNVGDTIRIYILNSGYSTHSMHFHGYHVRIVTDSRGALRQNWEKDSVPVHSQESMILELIPDKPGMFPVHDHNLVAVSGGGRYPNGMFLTMEIQ